MADHYLYVPYDPDHPDYEILEAMRELEVKLRSLAAELGGRMHAGKRS